MLDQNDKQLLAAYASGQSDDAFAELVRRHIDLVHSVALRCLRNPHQAEEVAQVVFTILAQKAARLHKNAVLEGWLYNTTRYTAISLLRSEIRRQRREQQVFMTATDDDSLAHAWELLAPHLEEAMASLGEADRNAVVLRFFKNKSLAELGDALGTKPSATQKRVTRAVEKLRSYFIKRGLKISAALLITTIGANSIQAAPAGLASSVAASAALKGAAASASTLTLIKATLKIMAWTKATIAVVATAIIVAGTGSVWTAQRIITRHDPVAVPGLIGWWKLDDIGATNIEDTSHIFAKNHGGIPVHNPGSVPGKKGRAVSLDRQKDQYVALGKIYQGSYKEFSVACWVKHPRSDWQIVVERSRPDDTDGLSLMMDNLGLSVDFGHYPDFVKSKTTVQDDQWHHVVGTMAPNKTRYTYSIYVDGELDNTAVLPRGLTATTNGWAIGARHTGEWPYQGLIDDVRLYDRALTANDVRRLFKN